VRTNLPNENTTKFNSIYAYVRTVELMEPQNMESNIAIFSLRQISK